MWFDARAQRAEIAASLCDNPDTSSKRTPRVASVASVAHPEAQKPAFSVAMPHTVAMRAERAALVQCHEAMAAFPHRGGNRVLRHLS